MDTSKRGSCWRNVGMWPNVQGERQFLRLEFPLIDLFLFRQLTKTSINFLFRREYFRCHDVRRFWWICQYTNCVFRI